MKTITIRDIKRHWIRSTAGWLPAIILPSATVLQLIPVLQGRTDGVSPVSWLMFGTANLGSYIFSTQKQTPQVILAFLLTSVMDFTIVIRSLLS